MTNPTQQANSNSGGDGQSPFPETGAEGTAQNIDILSDPLADREALGEAIPHTRDAVDLSAQAVKMHSTFGSALRKELERRMIDDMGGLIFWYTELQELLCELRKEAKAGHEAVRAAREARSDEQALLEDLLDYLLGRSVQDETAGALAGRLMEALRAERRADQ